MESRTHHSLVTMLYEYISDFSEVEQSLIESDIYEVGGSVTRMAEGFVPDLYYNHNKLTIIGEAKTEEDLERSHSIEQYKSYIKHLKNSAKKGNKCILVMSVPWGASITTYRIIKRILDKDIKLIIINELGVFRTYEKNSIE